MLHNKVRAFAGWPGTFAALTVSGTDGSSSQQQQLQVKILQSRVADADAVRLLQGLPPRQVVFADNGNRMLLPCGDGSALEVLQLQPPTKKAMEPKAFYNGLSGRQLSVAD